MSHIAAQGRHVAHLRAADQAAGFHQGLGVLLHQGRGDDLVVRQARANDQFIAAHFQNTHFGNVGQIHQGMYRRVMALLQVQH